MSDFRGFDDIDEIDILRAHRAPVLTLEREADDRIRRLILARLDERERHGDPDDLIDLRRFDQPGDDREVIILEPAVVDLDRSADRERQVTQRGGGGWLRPLAAATVILVLIGGALAVTRGGDGPSTPPATNDVGVAADPDSALVAAVGRQPHHPLGPGQFLHTAIDQGSLFGADERGPLIKTDRVETWVAMDGTVRLKLSDGEVRPVDDPSAPPIIDSGGDDIRSNAKVAEPLRNEQLATLPSDPAQLAALIGEAGGFAASNRAELIKFTLRLLEKPEVFRPEVRQGLARILENNGFRPTGPATARSGRTGDSYGVTLPADGADPNAPQRQWSVIFDGDGRLLQWEQSEGTAPETHVVAYVVSLDVGSSITDSAGAG